MWAEDSYVVTEMTQTGVAYAVDDMNKYSVLPL